MNNLRDLIKAGSRLLLIGTLERSAEMRTNVNAAMGAPTKSYSYDGIQGKKYLAEYYPDETLPDLKLGEVRYEDLIKGITFTIKDPLPRSNFTADQKGITVVITKENGKGRLKAEYLGDRIADLERNNKIKALEASQRSTVVGDELRKNFKWAQVSALVDKPKSPRASAAMNTQKPLETEQEAIKRKELAKIQEAIDEQQAKDLQTVLHAINHHDLAVDQEPSVVNLRSLGFGEPEKDVFYIPWSKKSIIHFKLTIIKGKIILATKEGAHLIDAINGMIKSDDSKKSFLHEIAFGEQRRSSIYILYIDHDPVIVKDHIMFNRKFVEVPVAKNIVAAIKEDLEKTPIQHARDRVTTKDLKGWAVLPLRHIPLLTYGRPKYFINAGNALEELVRYLNRHGVHSSRQIGRNEKSLQVLMQLQWKSDSEDTNRQVIALSEKWINLKLRQIALAKNDEKSAAMTSSFKDRTWLKTRKKEGPFSLKTLLKRTSRYPRVESKVISIVKEVMVKPIEVNFDSRLREDLEMVGDIQLITLSQSLKKDFKISFPEAMEGFDTVNDIVNYIVKEKRSNPSSVKRKVPSQIVENKNAAMNGGIDLNAVNIDMQRQGSGVDIKFDQAMIQQFKLGNFDGIEPIITQITPIANIYPLVGLKEQDEVGKVVV